MRSALWLPCALLGHALNDQQRSDRARSRPLYKQTTHQKIPLEVVTSSPGTANAIPRLRFACLHNGRKLELVGLCNETVDTRPPAQSMKWRVPVDGTQEMRLLCSILITIPLHALVLELEEARAHGCRLLAGQTSLHTAFGSGGGGNILARPGRLRLSQVVLTA
jgi:hypothetical protein